MGQAAGSSRAVAAPILHFTLLKVCTKLLPALASRTSPEPSGFSSRHTAAKALHGSFTLFVLKAGVKASQCCLIWLPHACCMLKGGRYDAAVTPHQATAVPMTLTPSSSLYENSNSTVTVKRV